MPLLTTTYAKQFFIEHKNTRVSSSISDYMIGVHEEEKNCAHRSPLC
jgi:hypothetical protein